MSRASALGAAAYETESSWGEDVGTYTLRMPILDQVDCSGLEQSKIDAARTVQYHGERTMPIRGVKGGSFSTRFWLTGHGSSTAGATSMSDLGTLLGVIIGNGVVSAASGTTLTGSTDADTWAATASDTFLDGGACFLGAAGDGDGEGLCYHIASHTGTAIEVKNAAVGAPVNGAVLYSAENIYPTAAPSASITGTRWQLLTANQQYECHGCWPMSITFDIPIGQPPSVTVQWGVSWWEEVSVTFPSADTVDAFSVAPVAGGNFFYQAHGTTTRDADANISIRSFTFTVNLNIVPLRGPGGVNEFQDIIGAVRTPYEAMIEISEDAQTASATPTRPGQYDSDTAFRHGVFSFSNAATGKKVGLIFKKMYFSGRRPVQSSSDGVNRFVSQFHLCADLAGSNDITRASYILALG